MHFLTGQWDSVRFIGLFGLLVYQFICQCILSLDSAIVSSLLVYFTMHSFTGQWDSVWFIGLFGLSVYFSMVYIGLDGWTSLLRGVCKHLIVVSTSNGSELGPVLSQIRTWQSELAFSNPTDPKTLGTFALRNRYPRQPIGTPPPPFWHTTRIGILSAKTTFSVECFIQTIKMYTIEHFIWAIQYYSIQSYTCGW